MGDYLNENPVDFWKRPDIEAIGEKSGPFIKGVEVLNDALTQYQDHLVADTIDGKEVLRSPHAVFINEFTGSKKHSTQAKACVYVDRQTNKTYFALDPDTANSDMHRFEVTSSGHLLNLDKVDEFGEAFGLSEKDTNLFDKAVGGIKQSLYAIEWREQNRREARKRRITQWASGVTVVSLIGGGAAIGLKEWYFDPKAEDKAARNAYDAEEHTLDTDNIPLVSQEVEAIPSDFFDEIPSFKDGEDFDSPRTVEMRGNSCTRFTGISIKGNDIVRVGLEEGDELLGSTVGISVEEDKKRVTICLMGPKSPGEGNKGGPEESELAIQVLSPQQLQ